MPVFTHSDYTVQLPDTHTFPMHRYEAVWRAMEQHCGKKDSMIRIMESRLATKQEVLSVHDENYVTNFSRGRLNEKQMRKIGFPFSYDFVRRTFRITGGSLSCVEHVLDPERPGDRVAGNLAGGTHHAFTAHGEGFCIFNDIACCTYLALHGGTVPKNVNRVVSLDFDVHQGNGTAEMLRNEPGAFTLSVHGSKNYPWDDEPSDLDFGVEDDVSEEEYLQVCSEALEKTSALLAEEGPFPCDPYGNQNSEMPELVIFQAGVDPLKSDRLGRLKMSRETLQDRNEMVYRWCKERGSRVVCLMGGGYSYPNIEDSVACHVDVFSQAADTLLS